MSAHEGLEGRVRRLEDIQEIHELVLKYRAALDARDLAAYASLFASNGRWSGTTTGDAEGPTAIRTLLEAALPPNPPAPGATTVHLITEPLIEFDASGDRATGICHWSLLERGPDDVPRIVRHGHYDDEYVREDGAWRFASRRGRVDMMG